MSYKNNANGELLGTIGASTTTMTIKDSKGGLFPDTYPFYLTIEQIENNSVSKREIVECTNKTGDTFTITRSAGYCPASDTATTQTNTAFSFEDGSLVQLRAVAEDFDSFQNQIDAKLDADGSLRTGLGNHKIIYTNGSGNETELALGTTSQVLTSNGPTSAPTFESPSVDINSQAEKTAPTGTDEALIYDGTGNKKTTLANLTKGLSQASETVKGTVERATNAEATAGTDTTRYITPKQAKDNYGALNNYNLNVSNISISKNQNTGSGTAISTELTATNGPIIISGQLSINKSGFSFQGDLVRARLEYFDGSSWLVGFDLSSSNANVSRSREYTYVLRKGLKARIIARIDIAINSISASGYMDYQDLI